MAAVANQRSPPPQLASDYYGELERPVFPWPGVLHSPIPFQNRYAVCARRHEERIDHRCACMRDAVRITRPQAMRIDLSVKCKIERHHHRTRRAMMVIGELGADCVRLSRVAPSGCRQDPATEGCPRAADGYPGLPRGQRHGRDGERRDGSGDT